MTVRPGWTKAALRELIVEGPTNGFSPQSDHGARGTLTLKLSATTSGRFVLNEGTTKRIHEEMPPESKFWLRPGDILIQRANTLEYVGTTALFDGPANTYIYPDLMMRIRSGAAADPAYLCAFLNAPDARRALRAKATGTAGNMPKVNGDAVRSSLVDLPPLNEQRRIVAKLEALQARSRRAREALDAVPPLLEKLRQSILAAAFRGDLTKDWRAKHKDVDVEPASKLLERIRAERRKKWEETELAKMAAKGKAPKGDEWKAKYREPEAVDIKGLPELPDGWCWTRLGDLGEDPLSAVQTGPFGAMLHNTEFVEDGVPVIAVGNLTGLGFTRDRLFFVTATKAKELARFDVQAGDVLFARSGATLGKVCVAPDYVRDWRMTGHILRLRLNTSLMRPEIAVYALAGAPPVKRQVTANVRGMTRPGYNTSLLEGIFVPVPPLGEQCVLLEVLGRALEQLQRATDARGDLVTSLSALDRSVLAKAFRGELVPQDPNDEPAEAMLARVCGAKTVTTNGAPSKRRRKSANVEGQATAGEGQVDDSNGGPVLAEGG